MINDLWPKIEPRTSEYKAEVLPTCPYYFMSYCYKINQSADMFLSVTQFPDTVALVIDSGIQETDDLKSSQ
jgi:hypothetical protein